MSKLETAAWITVGTLVGLPSLGIIVLGVWAMFAHMFQEIVL
jgi:hypothetical protein